MNLRFMQWCVCGTQREQMQERRPGDRNCPVCCNLIWEIVAAEGPDDLADHPVIEVSDSDDLADHPVIEVSDGEDSGASISFTM